MSTAKGVTYDEEGNIVSCLFCRICELKEPGDILFENSEYVVFRNINPVTDTHVLVTPRKHIKSFKQLSGDDGAQVLDDMMKIGKQALGFSTDELSDGSGILLQCFHVPPINSIDHLHLHCIQDPKTMSWTNSMKYYTNSFWCIDGYKAIEFVKSFTDNTKK